MDLGNAFKIARLNRFPKSEKTQGEVAAMAGITQTYLSQIEGNQKEPSVEVMKELAKVYQTPLPVIFFMAMEDKDVAKNKKRAFQILKPHVDALIGELLYKKS